MLQIVVDAKVDYPAACNAVEKVLVHSHWLTHPGQGADSGLRRLVSALEQAGVKVHGGRKKTRRAHAHTHTPTRPDAGSRYRMYRPGTAVRLNAGR